MGHGQRSVVTDSKPRKKLIEVALPLDAINKASAREKSIRHGHPSTLHLWWARRPLAAARAVIFAQMVDDPSAWPELFPTEEEQEAERRRLFGLIEELVVWKNTANEALLERAREEIRKSWRRTCADNREHPRAAELFDPERLPAFHDPFAGGGSLPLEAQRLGLEAHASDLNPVAVLINKAMIEIPPKFAGRPPVNPESRARMAENRELGMEREWKGAEGLAEDVRYYGRWMRDEAEKRIGHLYPKVAVTAEMAKERLDLGRYVGRELTVIAWLWARTVRSPNPAFRDVHVPLATTFVVSRRRGREAHVVPVVANGRYHFTVRTGPSPAVAKSGTSAGPRRAFRCLMSGTPITYDYIKSEGVAGRMGQRMLCIVAEGDGGRVYLPPIPEQEETAAAAVADWKPDCELPKKHRNFQGPVYGLTNMGDLFTPRQLVALNTLADLVSEAAVLGARASRPHLVENKRARRPRSQHKEWHSRGYLPHLDQPDMIQSITFRLADSVPAKVVAAWKEELQLTGGPTDNSRLVEVHERIERYADEGHGECWLRDERIAQLVEDALLHFDGTRYRLLEWVIMPNHVHVLIETVAGFPLDGVVHSWKSFTAKQANRILGRSGTFWATDYWDRYIRNDKHLAAAREYIHQNPVKAGLVQRAHEWRWGSALGARASRPHLVKENAGETPALPVYLALSVSRQANRSSNLNFWDPGGAKVQQVFGRQALPMVWDFVESNPICQSSGNFVGQVRYLSNVVEASPAAANHGVATQQDAQVPGLERDAIYSTDPPYFDNISYAALSDFFYVWLRRSLRNTLPGLFDTLAVPKAEELIATPHRHPDKASADAFFMAGMSKAMRALADRSHAAFPVTVYYAFKQAEGGRKASRMNAGETPALPATGWETFLDAVIRSGFAISGTWPVRTELTGNLKRQVSALASSIVLVCRKRPEDAPLATRRQFVDTLKSELPPALAHLQSGHIAPVDLAQAAIGPGMAVYTRYAKVVDASGNPVTVREALALINETLDEVLTAQEGDFDADTRWALAWFEQHGFEDGEYGVAETLSKAKVTTVFGLETLGILQSRGGKVRLLIPLALSPDWDPRAAGRVSAWLTVHHLIRAHDAGGEQAAAELVRKLGSVAETARELAYRLYAIAERTKRTREALWYNALVQSWPEIARLAREDQAEQEALLEQG